MNKKEHKAYLKEFKAYAKEITATRDSTKKFLVRTGINTPKGRLTRLYSTSVTVSKKSK
jgi:hypothetical protein